VSIGIDPIPQDDPLVDATRHMGERWYRWLSTVVDQLTTAIGRVAQTATVLPAVHRPSTSAAILPVTLLTPTRAGLVRVSWSVQVTAPATTSSAVTVTLKWTANSVAQTEAFPAITGNTTATHASGQVLIYPTSAQPITIETAYTSVGAAALGYSLDALVETAPS
jgi:hypothetical protein